MIAVDTSALIAILWGEAEELRLRSALEASPDGALISMANLLELQLVLLGRRSQTGWPEAQALLQRYSISPHPFNERQLTAARKAAEKYGKGHHRARLNFGDCFAYALAKVEDVPLLCTGKDFAATDIAIA